MSVSEYNLLDEFEISGYWWVPERPEERIAGTLTVNPQHGIYLQLGGVFNIPASVITAKAANGYQFKTEQGGNVTSNESGGRNQGAFSERLHINPHDSQGRRYQAARSVQN